MPVESNKFRIPNVMDLFDKSTRLPTGLHSYFERFPNESDEVLTKAQPLLKKLTPAPSPAPAENPAENPAVPPPAKNPAENPVVPPSAENPAGAGAPLLSVMTQEETEAKKAEDDEMRNMALSGMKNKLS